MSKPSTSKKSRSRLWFLVHGWLALPIWFFVLIVCVTGTLAVISQEIVWLANPEIRASKPFDDAPLLSFDQVIAAIAKSDPEVIVQQIIRPDEAHFALRADINYPDGRSVIVYVNPYTGVIQGISPPFDFKQFTRALHGWWLVPFVNGYSWGWYLVSLLGLPLLASLVTGLVVYKRFWKGFFKPTLRFNHGARIFWGDFHRLSGIWSIWFIAVISITGTWFLIQAILADNQISFASRPIPAIISHDSAPLMPDGRPAPMLGADEALRIAQQRVPGLDSSFVSLPGNAFSPIEVGGRSGYPLMYQTLQINPYTGKIEQSRLLSDRNNLEFVTESMRPLHTGDFGGLWIKLIWFFFGLVLSMMVLSGLLIWTKRTALATAQALKRSAKTERVPAPKAHAALNAETPEVTP
ncbi:MULTISPECIES: PepSY domain-containing protein [Pseudomonas]|uniref:PepSY-associated TM helix domain-containing protein n=1 Tax=Pseudomonas TaxID=286 RepID=UPI000CD4D6A1|nr:MULTISPECIES: PepSY domain-containing protein [Pseudomonas]RBH55296.1 PepSY domain-containing protein [Pseudomonas sp. MWU13-2860]